jgi:hypothetical protein
MRSMWCWLRYFMTSSCIFFSSWELRVDVLYDACTQSHFLVLAVYIGMSYFLFTISLGCHLFYLRLRVIRTLRYVCLTVDSIDVYSLVLIVSVQSNMFIGITTELSWFQFSLGFIRIFLLYFDVGVNFCFPTVKI